MDKLVIFGGRPLTGTVHISGAKNAVLPVMAATLLADGQYRIKNVPNLRDVRTMSALLQTIGGKAEFHHNTLNIEISQCDHFEAPYDLVKTMRASIYVLGPLVGRYGYAKVSLPGGCAWGPRPVNMHIEALRKMGADIQINQGYILAKAKKLKGTKLLFDFPSVGATGNILMAAVLAEGTTIIHNAAKEPEITALVRFLKKMGAFIRGAGTEKLEIEGVGHLHSTETVIIPDRIEAGTFLIAAHITGSRIRLESVYPRHIGAVISKVKDSGAQIIEGNRWIDIVSNGQISPVNISTSVYPGFPTDMQAQWMALMSIAKGSSVITDTIFEDRFTHVSELQRLGATIQRDRNMAVVKGVKSLSGAPVMSTDLRASASLILAGLVAKGRTEVSRIYHIDRGYERIEEKLKQLGANIYRDQE